MNDGDPTAAEPPPPAAAAPAAFGSTTAKYLDDRAAESFKRQTELEESVWRSLPLFTGGLLAAGAIVTSTARALPPFKGSFYQWVAYSLLALALVAFSIAFWWLWQVVKPRDFDYPPLDEEVSSYAAAVVAYHEGQGLAGEPLDEEVTRELRIYMADAFASAAKSTFRNNQSRLSARSQVLIFLLSGFLLAFVCDATIFGHRLFFEPTIGARDHARQGPQPHGREGFQPGKACTTVPTGDAGDPRRGLVDQNQHRSAGPEQVDGGHGKADKRGRRSTTYASGKADPTAVAAPSENRASSRSSTANAQTHTCANAEEEVIELPTDRT